jgi:ribonuclease Y
VLCVQGIVGVLLVLVVAALVAVVLVLWRKLRAGAPPADHSATGRPAAARTGESGVVTGRVRPVDRSSTGTDDRAVAERPAADDGTPTVPARTGPDAAGTGGPAVGGAYATDLHPRDGAGAGQSGSVVRGADAPDASSWAGGEPGPDGVAEGPAGEPGPDGRPGGRQRGLPDRAALLAEARRSVDLELSSIRLQALQEAAAAKAEADTVAAMTRRLAEAEAANTRRVAQSQADAIRGALEAEAENTRRQAELEASTTLLDSRRRAEREATEITDGARVLKLDVERREARLADREERLDAETRRLEQRDKELTGVERGLAERETEMDARAVEHERELERIAGLTAADAKAELLRAVEAQARRDVAIVVRDIEAEAREQGESRARKIVVDAIQRVASEQTAESVVSVLHLPSDEMKGRIIGREGRNIRAFESVTGVNLIIDDTPEAVLLSCFDPVRREIGRITLEKLVLDGRIHPHRIEEVHERSKEEVELLCLRAGEDALVEVGISDLHPELVAVLGHLRYRTSYGQNVLKHLIETAHIAGIMSAELGLEPTVIKRGAFLHDIGKALTHEVEGSHARVGADLARKYGESEDVVHAIEAHHNEVAPRTIAAVLTQAADACSGGRPGARRESLESYVKRLERIEEIATAKPGVEKVFAMQAGREVRVMVQPDHVDDLAAQLLAREVAKQIEDELTYPGQIRVTVVRESRATEIAK